VSARGERGPWPRDFRSPASRPPEPPPESPPPEPPVPLGSWGRLYALVIAALAVDIALLILLTERYR
jgi:hypothetical protein